MEWTPDHSEPYITLTAELRITPLRSTDAADWVSRHVL